MKQTLDISWQTIIKIFIAGFAFYILFLARHIIVWLFFGLMISVLLEPAIEFLRKFKIPKLIAVIVVYLFIFGLVGLAIYFIAPTFAAEIAQFIQNIPTYFEKIHPLLKDLGFNVAQDFQGFTAQFAGALEDSSKSVIRAITVLFGGISSTLVIFIFSFYISLEERGVEKTLALLTPKKYEESVLYIFQKAQYKVAGWFGARLLACVFVGILSLIVFLFFGVKYVLILSLISGALTFIPFIGPLITAIAVLLFVGASDSWATAIYIVIALVIIQELENKIITPLLMKKFLDMPPLIVLIAILVGGTIFGILGIIFAVPVCGIVYEFLKEFLEKNKERLSEYS